MGIKVLNRKGIDITIACIFLYSTFIVSISFGVFGLLILLPVWCGFTVYILFFLEKKDWFYKMLNNNGSVLNMAKSKEKKLLKDVAESKRWLKEHPNVEKKYIKMAESYEPKEKAEELELRKVDEKRFIQLCKEEGCFSPPYYRVLGEYANTPEYIRLFCEELGREGVIQEIEKLFMNGDIEFWVLYKKDWERFKRKNGKV